MSMQNLKTAQLRAWIDTFMYSRSKKHPVGSLLAAGDSMRRKKTNNALRANKGNFSENSASLRSFL